MAKLTGAKTGRGVGQHREADDIQAVAIPQPGLVDEHPFAKVALGIALDFDMDQHRDFLTIECLHAHQFVGVAATVRAVGADLLQFLVEKRRRHAPVDPAMNGREQQREELREEAFQRLFPGAVVVVLWRLGGRKGGVGGHGGECSRCVGGAGEHAPGWPSAFKSNGTRCVPYPATRLRCRYRCGSQPVSNFR